MRAQASIENDGLGDHRQVDSDAVPGLNAELRQGIGRLADLVLKLAVGDRASIARFTLEVDGDLVAESVNNVPVNTIDGDVDASTDEPLGEGRIRPVEGCSPAFSQLSRPACSSPEGHSVANGLGVHRDAGIGLFGEFRRWREVAVLVQQVLKMIGGHQPNASVDQTLLPRKRPNSAMQWKVALGAYPWHSHWGGGSMNKRPILALVGAALVVIAVVIFILPNRSDQSPASANGQLRAKRS